MAVKVIVADDHRIIREGLKELLEGESNLEVVAEAEDGRTMVKLCREYTPDVVIMDITMPDLNGIDATRQITAEMPRVKVIALSMHSNRKFIREMMNAGAFGYLLKDSAFEELSTAIHAVCNNHVYVSSQLKYRDHRGEVRSTSSPPLTSREREVLQLLAEGKTTRQISSMLSISEKTVATHRSRIMDKLGIKGVAELTKYAINEGLTSVDA